MTDDPTKFVMSALGAENAAMEHLEDGSVLALLPEETARRLEVPEEYRFRTEATPDTDAEVITYGTESLSRIAQLARGRGRTALASIPEVYLKKGDLEPLARENLQVSRASREFLEAKEVTVSYLVLNVYYRTVSVETKEGIVTLVLNESSGAHVTGMLEALASSDLSEIEPGGTRRETPPGAAGGEDAPPLPIPPLPLGERTEVRGADVRRGEKKEDEEIPLPLRERTEVRGQYEGYEPGTLVTETVERRLPLEGLLARVKAWARKDVEAEIGEFVESMNRRLARDWKRVGEYYGQLSREIGKKIARTRKEETASKLKEKRKAIAADLEEKRRNVVARYAVRVDMAVAAALRVHSRALRITCRIRRRDEERDVVTFWNSLTKSIELLCCEACFRTARAFVVCNGLHTVCSDCTGICPSCGRRYCKACDPEGCPKCGKSG